MKKILLSLGFVSTLYALFAFVYVPRAVIYGDRHPVTKNPSAVGVAFEDLTLQPEDTEVTLQAWWMEVPNPVATLVFVHGGGSNRHTDFFRALDFYKAMTQRNVSILTLDLRNHGASGAAPGGLQFGRTEKEDVKAAVKWAKAYAGPAPLFVMGISMGGATVIQAAADGMDVDGMILLDPLLDTQSAFTRGVAVTTGLPEWLFVPSAWAATAFYNLPSGPEEARVKAAALTLPMLIIQAPDDPVTLAVHSRPLAEKSNVDYWLTPPVNPEHPALAWKKAWGSHVSAFELFPEETLARTTRFMILSR